MTWRRYLSSVCCSSVVEGGDHADPGLDHRRELPREDLQRLRLDLLHRHGEAGGARCLLVQGQRDEPAHPQRFARRVGVGGVDLAVELEARGVDRRVGVRSHSKRKSASPGHALRVIGGLPMFLDGAFCALTPAAACPERGRLRHDRAARGDDRDADRHLRRLRRLPGRHRADSPREHADDGGSHRRLRDREVPRHQVRLDRPREYRRRHGRRGFLRLDLHRSDVLQDRQRGLDDADRRRWTRRS